MKSREEFEALVKKKIESKKGIAVQNRRAWESVAATVVACLLIFWISYLAVPRLMQNPMGTGEHTDGDSGETSSDGSETKTEITDQESMTDTVTSTETTKTDSDLEFPEPEEGASTILPDVAHLTAAEVMTQLRSKSCPEELLPKLKEELSLSELAELLPYFTDMTVWSILSGTSFYTPAQFNTDQFLYSWHEVPELTERELELVGVWFEDEAEPWFSGGRLTTAELNGVLKDYLGVKINPFMLQLLKDEYEAEMDAYYGFHTDHQVILFMLLLQGWRTADGDYLIRFWEDEEGELGDNYVLLVPYKDSYRIGQFFSMYPYDPYDEVKKPQSVNAVTVVGGRNETYLSEAMTAIYERYLDLPLTRCEEPTAWEKNENYVMTLTFEKGETEEIVLTYDKIRIGSIWYMVDIVAYGQLKNTLSLAFDTLPEPGEAALDSSQLPIKQSDLAAVLEATGCPKELLSSVGEGMTDEELERLLPYFRDLAVQSILSGDPFAKPEDIDLGMLLYYQYGQEGGISEEERKAFFGEDDDTDFIGTRLTTTAFREILMTYLDVELTDAMLDTLDDVTYLEAFDAYYMYHHDYHVMTPIVLQGWHTADGGYLIRFYRINGELSGWEKDWFVHLTPAGDSLVVKQLLSLESPLKH